MPARITSFDTVALDTAPVQPVPEYLSIKDLCSVLNVSRAVATRIIKTIGFRLPIARPSAGDTRCHHLRCTRDALTTWVHEEERKFRTTDEAS